MYKVSLKSCKNTTTYQRVNITTELSLTSDQF